MRSGRIAATARPRCVAIKDRTSLVGAVHLFLTRGNTATGWGEILLLRRYNTGYNDGNYSVPAGHIDPGESAIAAMVREATEEIGVDIDPLHVHMEHVMHRRSVGTDCTNSERVDFFFTAGSWSEEPINLEPHKCDDLSWFPLTELPSNTVQYVRSAVEMYVHDIPYSEYGWDATCPRCGFGRP